MIEILTFSSPVVGLLGMVFAVLTFFSILKLPEGNEKMKKIAGQIHKGAMTFLRREYSIIAIFMVVVGLILGIFINPWTGVAYIFGACCSLMAGWFGMQSATKSSSPTCQGAKEGGISSALEIAFKGGSVMGISVAALGLIGIGITFLLAKMGMKYQIPMIVSGFSMGASSIALFARVGGGIYTKSADVGSDLVGKLEAGIPEDDPRNPGVIADNVGDNVGDTAGMGADLFESYVGSVVSAIALALTLERPESFALMSYPVILIGMGLVASLAGVMSISLLKKMEPQTALRNATLVSAGIFILGAFLISMFVMNMLFLFWAILAGMVCGILIGIESEYFTSGSPVKDLAESSKQGVAPLIINGLSLGFMSSVLPLITICAAIFVAYTAGYRGTMPPGGGGPGIVGMGLYCIALAGVGMLSTIGIVMSTDSYGPIADNAGGIAEMSGAGEDIRKITDKLDSLGNTTAAIGKGFAIGSAALTALALFTAYQSSVGVDSSRLSLANYDVLIGLLLGATMPFLISAWTMSAVGRTAGKMVEEIRRQFKEIKGLLQGEAEPDIEKCVDIVTTGSLREMIVPGITAVVAPLLVGFIIGPAALAGFLAGATATGVLLGIFMANAGAAWDNSKKYIEAGNLGGKGSDCHKAAVVGDTVGDPFKDTTGPSMNILIKLMSVVSLVFAPLISKFWS